MDMTREDRRQLVQLIAKAAVMTDSEFHAWLAEQRSSAAASPEPTAAFAALEKMEDDLRLARAEIAHTCSFATSPQERSVCGLKPPFEVWDMAPFPVPGKPEFLVYFEREMPAPAKFAGPAEALEYCSALIEALKGRNPKIKLYLDAHPQTLNEREMEPPGPYQEGDWPFMPYATAYCAELYWDGMPRATLIGDHRVWLHGAEALPTATACSQASGRQG